MLTKITVEAALNAELDEHLGYARHEQSQQNNYRNGYSSKIIRTEDGEVDLDAPRDRDSSFEPQLVKKNQTRFTSMDDKILYLYSKGMTTRDIVATFKEMYDAEVSPSLISRVINAVIEQVIEWQAGHSMRFIPLFIWTVWWLKSGKTNAWLIKQFISP